LGYLSRDMHHIDLKHEGLRKFRRLSGTDQYVLEQRARVQTEKWDERWRRRGLLDRHSEELLGQLPDFEAQRAQAARATVEAQQAVEALGSILSKGTEAAPFKMEMLCDSRIFPEPRPVAPVDQPLPPAPKRSDPLFDEVEINLKDLWPLLLLNGKQRQEKTIQLRQEAAQAKYDLALKDWRAAKGETARQNAKARALFEEALDAWWDRALAYQKHQQEENRKIDKFRQRYAQGQPNAVIEFLDAALSHSDYPDIYPMRWEMGFEPRTGALVIDYELPAPESFPTLKAVKFDVLRDCFTQSHWSEAEVAQLYDSALHQTCLRSLRDAFAADEAEVISSITFNGWVNYTDKMRGTPARACIMSVQAARDTIRQANFQAVDPKAYFRKLGGEAGARLADLAPVIPISWLPRAEDPSAAAEDELTGTRSAAPSLSPSFAAPENPSSSRH